MNADLHCHSTVSDGTLSPEAIAQRAHAQGVQLWALTDHDELGGQAQALAQAHALGMDALTGVEISVSFAGITVHIVGLGFDAENLALVQGLRATRGGREQRAKDIAAELAKVGIEGAYEGALKFVGNPDLISRTHFARFLVESGVCRDTHDVFRKYLGDNKPGFVPHRWASLGDAVRWITQAGGEAVIAHPARYKLSPSAEFALFTEFKTHGGRGVEVVTGSHTAAEALRYADMAQEFDLLASRGSDFHSPLESHTELGQLPDLPKKLTPIWEAIEHRVLRANPAQRQASLFEAQARMTAPSPLATHAPHSATRAGLGVVLIVLMGLCFATMDNSIRWLGATAAPVLLILWARYSFQALAMALVLAWRWARAPKAPSPAPSPFACAHPRFQLTRGLLLLATSACSFFGVQFMPVPEFTAINMLTPVIVTMLAAWLLHEHVTRLRWALVVGCFVGALIVIRPGSGLFGWAVLLPLAGALNYASFQILTRKLSGLEPPLTTHFYTGLVGSVLLSALVWGWMPGEALQWLVQASTQQWLVLLLIGATGTTGHLFLIFALGMAPTAVLMPFAYVQIGSAALVAYWMMGHVPDAWAFAGMAVVAGCGATSAWLTMKPLPPAAEG